MQKVLVSPPALPRVLDETGLADPSMYLHSVSEVLEQLPVPAIEAVVSQLFGAYCQDRAVYVFGNGGSAALASHIACDLGKGTAGDNTKPFRVLSLTDNVSLMTAWANDTSYENVFAGQLRPLIHAGDIALAISGSGNSPNVLSALSASREAGGFNIGLTGFEGGKMKALCDLCITAPSDNMQQIEDSHVCVMHAVFLALCRLIRNSDLALAAHGASA
jgi:D-sedoheptulose 7-phosphate isomerase